MSKEVSKREQPEEVAKLTTDEAEKALEDSVALIDKLRPKEPAWAEEYCPEMPLRSQDNTVGFVIFAGVLGGLVGTLISLVGSILVDWVITDIFLGKFYGLIAGAGFAVGQLIYTSKTLPTFIASGYKGSQTKQPIRAKLARMIYKNNLDKLEYRLREYEAYQQALEVHQIVIEKERKKLEDQKIFELLSTGTEFVILDECGRVETKKKPLNGAMADEKYKSITLEMLDYLQAEKEDRTSQPNLEQ